MQTKLSTINSVTKYPSIPTYHHLGERGRLLPEHRPLPDPPLFFSEKIDGTNARIILSPENDCFIGSRENLLWAKGDRIGDPAQGIVSALRETADRMVAGRMRYESPGWIVVFGEVYGGRTTACRGYGDEIGFRVFDVQDMSASEMDTFDQSEPQRIAAWREAGGQRFRAHGDLCLFADNASLQTVPLLIATPPPDSLQDVQAWLKGTATMTKLGGGSAEGVVVRSEDRSFICKIRHEDYARTLR